MTMQPEDQNDVRLPVVHETDGDNVAFPRVEYRGEKFRVFAAHTHYAGDLTALDLEILIYKALSWPRSNHHDDRPDRGQTIPLGLQTDRDDPSGTRAVEVVRIGEYGSLDAFERALEGMVRRAGWGRPDAVGRLRSQLHRLAPTVEDPSGTAPDPDWVDHLLAGWGIGPGSAPASPERMHLLARLRFGRKGAFRYGDRRWPTPAREEALLFDFGLEPGVPPIVRATVGAIHRVGAGGAVHRKPVTLGCDEAAAQRIDSETLARGTDKAGEIKTLLVRPTLAGGGADADGRLVAFHLRADGYVDEEKVADVGRVLGLDLVDRESGALRLSEEAAAELELASGRLNPLSLQIAGNAKSQPIVHVFDKGVFRAGKCFTNAGRNTWGVELPSGASLLAALRHCHSQWVIIAEVSA
jgi:hypothetical protein